MALRKTSIRKTVICLFILVLSQVNLKAQVSPYDTAFFEEAAVIQEKVECFTDRSLYITDEVIQFRANIHCFGNTLPREWSSVLYAELFSGDGKRAAAGKYLIQNQIATGELAIPSGILTGNYCLRCYTRWMRNSGPETYSYVPVRIVNPKRQEINVVNGSAPDGLKLTEQNANQDLLKFSNPETVYKRGDEITLNLIDSQTDIQGETNGCITVVPLAVKPGEPMFIQNLQNKKEEDFQVTLLPDLFGATLSGSVFQKGTKQQTLQEVAIHFTLFGDKPDYLITHSDKYGKFELTLPYREKKLQLLVQPEFSGTENVEVRIDPDFDPRIPQLQINDFYLSEDEKRTATILMRNTELDKIYQEADSVRKAPVNDPRLPFYGTPVFSLNMNDFVVLPTLEEVFFNLVPNVNPVNRDKTLTLTINGLNPLLTRYKPLLMIDEVPVFNIDRFRSVPTGKISRIDVINEVYQKGDMRFGGIINLHTKDKDLAGIDLPESAFFMDVSAFQSTHEKTVELSSSTDRIPDTRNTLLWIPELKVSKESRITFVAPDYPGEYIVLFRGEDEEGNRISAERIIHIE